MTAALPDHSSAAVPVRCTAAADMAAALTNHNNSAAVPVRHTEAADTAAALTNHNSAAVPAGCTVVSADIPVRLPASAVHMNPDSTVSADHILTVRDTAAALPDHSSAAVPVRCTAAAALTGHNFAADTADHIPNVPVHYSAYLSVPDYPLMTIYHPCGYHLHYSVHPCCHLPPM